MARDTHLQLPGALNGYEFRPGRSEFEIILPEATTNLVTNPGFELSTSGWSAGGGTLGRVAGDVFRGVYCARYIPGAAAGDGLYFGTLALTAGQSYAFSVRVKGAAGQKYRIFFADTSGNAQGAQVKFTATGRWQYVWVVWRETATNNRRIYIAKDTANTSTQPFYIDDVQVEAKAYPTTYCDGDLRGYVRGRIDYSWAGKPHLSTSSRSSTCAHGGRAVNMKRFGFRILAVVGLGWGFVLNRSTPLANGGAIYQDTVQTERQFTIAGVIDGKSQDIRRNRADLAAALHANRVGIDQPVLLRHTPIEGGQPAGDQVEIPALYESGLQVNLDNNNQSQITLSFSLYLPYMSTGRSQSTLIPWQTVSPAAGLILRYANSGAYAIAPNTISGKVAVNPVDGLVYTSANGVPTSWDPVSGTTTTLSGSIFVAGNHIYVIAPLPNGDVVYAGEGSIQRYRLATGTWDSAINSNGSVYAFAYSQANGYMAVGGSFTTFNGGAANRVSVSTDGGVTWSALGAGADGAVTALAWGLDGDLLYLGGTFNNFASNSSQRFAYWSMSVGGVAGLPLMVSTFTGASVNSIAVGQDGWVYVGGSLGAVSASLPDPSLVKLQRTWPVMSVGSQTTTGSTVNEISIGPDGELYVSFGVGGFSGVTAPPAAAWGGGRPVYSVKNGIVRLFDGAIAADDGLDVNARGDVVYNSHAQDGTPYSASVSVINESSADSWPTIVIDGPATVRRIASDTTWVSLDLQLSVSSGERVFAEFAPDGLRLYSQARQNLMWSLMPGSNISAFKLSPGANNVRVFATCTAIVTTGIASEWSSFVIGGITSDNSDGGKLYVNVVDVTGNRRLDIYKDSARTQLVAQSAVSSNRFRLTAMNGSGLSGYVASSAAPPTISTTMVVQFGLVSMTWPIVHDSIDAAVE